jgi:hypothetical protein
MTPWMKKDAYKKIEKTADRKKKAEPDGLLEALRGDMIASIPFCRGRE